MCVLFTRCRQKICRKSKEASRNLHFYLISESLPPLTVRHALLPHFSPPGIETCFNTNFCLLFQLLYCKSFFKPRDRHRGKSRGSPNIAALQTCQCLTLNSFLLFLLIKQWEFCAFILRHILAVCFPSLGAVSLFTPYDDKWFCVNTYHCCCLILDEWNCTLTLGNVRISKRSFSV